MDVLLDIYLVILRCNNFMCSDVTSMVNLSILLLVEILHAFYGWLYSVFRLRSV
ncbi:hypothetical protein DSUL_260046 [Desulfovibrionales bacterium]